LTNRAWNPKRLKKARKELNLTQGGLAQKLGVDRVTVQNWEAGKEPSGANLAELCRIADKPASYFYTTGGGR
jgi:DNA-binding transcriptional regulator YiaG